VLEDFHYHHLSAQNEIIVHNENPVVWVMQRYLARKKYYHINPVNPCLSEKWLLNSFVIIRIMMIMMRMIRLTCGT